VGEELPVDDFEGDAVGVVAELLQFLGLGEVGVVVQVVDGALAAAEGEREEQGQQPQLHFGFDYKADSSGSQASRNRAAVGGVDGMRTGEGIRIVREKWM
jgi:hypothetical protein